METPEAKGTSMTNKCAKLPVARVAALGIVLLSGILPALAQPAVKKEYAFRGKVEQVDANAKRLTVASEPIEGWMGAMTMVFKVSNEDRFQPDIVFHLGRRQTGAPSAFRHLGKIGERALFNLKRLHFLQEIRSGYRGKAVTTA